MDFSKILNWKLLTGSHDFPGPDGGTCINEAAIIAAGFEYKKVRCASDCPPCFSRPIASYAIHLNDSMQDNFRNELLMPFVTRLSGTADTPTVERRRQEYMIIQISKRLISMQLRALGRHDDARRFAQVETIEDVRQAALALARALALDLDLALARALDLALALALDLARARALALRREFWSEATKILDEAIMLGNHGDAIDQELVIARMAKIRERPELIRSDL
jgi:hypothetical protein